MPMTGLKLTVAASIYTNPYKLVVTHITTTTRRTSKLSLPPPPPSCGSSGRRISSCASLTSTTTPAAHVSPHHRNRNKNVGHYYLTRFRGPKLCSSSGPPRSSSAIKAGSSGSIPTPPIPNLSSGSDLAADMVSEKKTNNDDWYNNKPPSIQQQQQQQLSTKLLTLPTILTLGRVAAVPLLICTFYVDSWWGRTATTSIFITAAITDWLDGYIARKMRLSSVFGAFLDPVADKLMVAATLVLLCTKPLEIPMLGQVPWLLTVPSVAIIGREITMSAVREWAASQNTKLLEAVAVNNLGKWKTATQMTALTILLATRDSSVGGSGILVGSGLVLLYISAGLSLYSLAVYMGKIWKVLLK